MSFFLIRFMGFIIFDDFFSYFVWKAKGFHYDLSFRFIQTTPTIWVCWNVWINDGPEGYSLLATFYAFTFRGFHRFSGDV